MTNKQLFKRLIYQLNRLLDINYLFDINLLNDLDFEKSIDTKFFSIYISNKNNKVIYHNYFGNEDTDLTEKLQELKQFVDDLFNK